MLYELTDAAKAVDRVGDIKDAAMTMDVVDEVNTAGKAVDNVIEWYKIKKSDDRW